MNDTVSLNFHQPPLRDVKEYEDWVFVVKASFIIRFNPWFKFRFVQKLCDKYGLVLKVAHYPLSLIEGSQTITIGQLFETMQSIGVDYLRLNSFGIKSPI